MQLRKYKNEDAKTIAKWIKNERELRLWSANRYENYPITEFDIINNYKECQRNNNFYPLTLVDKNNIIGHLIIRNPCEDLLTFRLGFIIINPYYRKQGYGKKIINEAIEYAKKNYNAKNFNLGVFIDNENALNCYLNAGFKIIDIEKNVFKFYDEYWDCAEMVYEK